jgi:hypothetical protein
MSATPPGCYVRRLKHCPPGGVRGFGTFNGKMMTSRFVVLQHPTGHGKQREGGARRVMVIYGYEHCSVCSSVAAIHQQVTMS